MCIESANDVAGVVQSNYARLAERVGEAAVKSGRAPGDISVVVVTKAVSAEVIRCLPAAGVTDIGENRVGQALERRRELADLPLRWHMVGHLQRNKAKKALEFADVVHSVESAKLVGVLDRELAERISEREGKLDIFLEVNVSGERQKYGVPPDGVKGLIEKAYAADFLAVRGLMTMAPFVADPEEARPVFAGLRELRDRLVADGDLAPGDGGLSMGMTNDFEVAVEEGATTIRVGTYLFQGRAQR